MSLVNNTFYPEHLCLTVKTESQWSTLNPVLLEGEIAVSSACTSGVNNSHSVRMKLGDGVSHWSALTYTDEALTALVKQYETLTSAMLQNLNALTTKLEKEEGYI